MIDRIADFVIRRRTWGYNTDPNDHSLSISKWLDIPINGEINEVPGVFINKYLSWSQTDTAFRIVVPLIPSAECTSRRLVRGAFMDFMRSPNIGRFQGVHMASGNTYYGIPGIIFDNEFNLLLMVTYTIKKDTNSTYTITRVNCLVSPKVFDHQDRIIEKTIIKKIIPFCASHHLDSTEIALNRYMRNASTGTTIKVIVDDCSNFISSASIPSPSSLTEDKIKSFLISHEEDLL